QTTMSHRLSIKYTPLQSNNHLYYRPQCHTGCQSNTHLYRPIIIYTTDHNVTQAVNQIHTSTGQ
ncbi:hypothetical protein LOTGIDRAFT_148717, partial [Lottia gigantea]